MNHKIIFITWTNYSPHSVLLSRAFNADLYYINNLINTRQKLWKLFFIFDYFFKSFKTLKIIWGNKPKVVVVQNPPSIAPVVIVFFNVLRKYKILIDSHNGAFEKPWVSVPFHKWAMKHADLVLVHNNQLLNELKDDLNYKNVNFMMLNSKIAEFSEIKKEEQTSSYILVITTFSGDEPMEILLEGIKNFNENYESNIRFKITGNYNKNLFLFSKYSKFDNIDFLGFVNEEEYKYLLINAFGVISLSKRDNVQQFSLMEAIGAEVPFISSNNLTNRALFGEHMPLTENTVIDISRSINIFKKDIEKFRKNILIIKKELSEKWENDFSKVKKEIFD